MNNNDTFELITRLSNERLEIWRQAGHQFMTEEMRTRLHQIEGQLPTLWDLLRREVAGGRKREPVQLTDLNKAA
jgi:hypothetical protein